ncbi:Diacylglycerol kinase gamma [Frankliniella fusca]|uniref:Diacylglycerol kinase gamma n=1 Tax=Frankliniella fusca TaxID=407009 RepID=A0AAE1LD12_9NEOP|nr:Diacylglycerol kinase gamma [Frankliniella fusca]
MALMRVAVLALLVACASSALAADEIIVSDIDNNEVLPENDVVRARVDEVPASAPVTTDAPGGGSTPAPTPTAESAPETTQRADAADKTTVPPPVSTTAAAKDADASTTSAPPRQPSTLSRFLSDIIQIPIAVLRSVGTLLSNTFNGHRGNSSSTAAPAPAPSTP